MTGPAAGGRDTRASGRDWASDLHRTEVDGVTTLWADEPGPLRATLAFRTGVADEGLGQRGWTHAVEHLALTRHGTSPHAHNGAVDLLTTRFVTHGSAEDVAAVLTDICTDLHALPADRLDTERRVLSVEAQRAGRTDELTLLQLRYGLRTTGLVGRPEWGLPGVTADQLAGWAATRFTRGNAVLCLTGPPPPGLRLPLPDGALLAPPDPVPAIPDGRHWVVDAGVQAAALSLVLPEGPLAPLLEHAVQARLFRRLRVEEGIGYDPGVRRAVLDARARHLLLSTDSRPQDRFGAARALVEISDELGAAGPTGDEVEAWRQQLTTAVAHLDATAVLDRAASRHLLDLPDESLDELVGSAEGADPVAAREIWRAGSAGSLLVVALGEQSEDDWAPDHTWSRLPAWSPRLPAGEPVYRGEDDHSRLIVTPEGVGRHLGPDRFVTVLWADCAGVLGWDDGTRLLLGDDGAALLVDPADWPDGGALPALLDAATPHDVVGQGPRDAPRPARAPARPAGQQPPAPRAPHPPERPGAPRRGTVSPEHRAAERLARVRWIGLGLLVLALPSVLSPVIDQSVTSRLVAVAAAVGVVVFLAAGPLRRRSAGTTATDETAPPPTAPPEHDDQRGPHDGSVQP